MSVDRSVDCTPVVLSRLGDSLVDGSPLGNSGLCTKRRGMHWIGCPGSSESDNAWIEAVEVVRKLSSLRCIEEANGILEVESTDLSIGTFIAVSAQTTRQPFVSKVESQRVESQRMKEPSRHSCIFGTIFASRC